MDRLEAPERHTSGLRRNSPNALPSDHDEWGVTTVVRCSNRRAARGDVTALGIDSTPPRSIPAATPRSAEAPRLSSSSSKTAVSVSVYDRQRPDQDAVSISRAVPDAGASGSLRRFSVAQRPKLRSPDRVSRTHCGRAPALPARARSDPHRRRTSPPNGPSVITAATTLGTAGRSVSLRPPRGGGR